MFVLLESSKNGKVIILITLKGGYINVKIPNY